MKIDTQKIIDISMDLNEKTLVWIHDPQPKLKQLARMPKDECNFTWLDFGGHAGTHVDAPYYLFPDKWTADQIPLARLIGICQVLDLSHVKDMITSETLRKHDMHRSIVLLKTKNSYDPLKKYNPKHVAVTQDAARYLIKKGVTTLGYDYQSFEREGKHDIHRMFLSKNITLVDNLRLKNAEQKDYLFICLPLKVTGTDAAPARAILIDG